MMKVSNMNIPVKAENNPKSYPTEIDTQKTSVFYGCRDPYILLYGGKYYFYRGMGGNGIGCAVSDDLENWSKPQTVFAVPENFHGVKDLFWAPECHYYKGHFYIFTSVFSGKYNHRTISVYRADNPLGPFTDIADGCITPKDWDAIDGTLYVDEQGQPWMVFVHEWTSMPDHNGGMCAAKLSEDFTHFISEPVQLFLARDPEWATNGVTDGPYVFTQTDGKIGMIWSNSCKEGYCVGVAYSDGKIDGNWSQREDLLYCRHLTPDFNTDGGHAMIFYDKDGKAVMPLHGPNGKYDGSSEHLQLFELEEKNGTIGIKCRYSL